MARYDEESIAAEVVKRLIGGTAIGVFIVLALLFLNPVVIINAGERGVLKNWGAVSETTFNEGWNWRIPIMQSVDVYDVKVQKYPVTATAASADLQTVTTNVAVNYKLRPESVSWLRQNVGMDYREKLIEPAVQEIVKAATAKFTAQELISRRPEVRDNMEMLLQEKLQKVSGNSIVIEAFAIENFQFSPEFDRAIEAKQVAEQNAQQAAYKLEQVKLEAQQALAMKEAEAQALKLQVESLKQGSSILQLRWIEKWDGHLPQYYFTGGSATPLIGMGNLPSMMNFTSGG